MYEYYNFIPSDKLYNMVEFFPTEFKETVEAEPESAQEDTMGTASNDEGNSAAVET